jgi:trehalose-phosphatase
VIYDEQITRVGGKGCATEKAELDTFFDRLANAPRSLLMLDFDGTLAPFRTDRQQAFPYPGVTQVLSEIRKTEITRVVLVSGRDAREIVSLLSMQPHPEIWGLHGLQRLAVDGSIRLPEVDESARKALTAARDWLFSQHLEHAAEFKTGSIAVHWRGLDEAETERIRRLIKPNWTAIAKHYGLHLLEFDGGLEMRSRRANKGSAVHALLNEMDAETPVAYLGDDTTDEDAFEAINGIGLSILVRPAWRPTAARLWLRPPGELMRLLERWLKACQALARFGRENNLLN